VFWFNLNDNYLPGIYIHIPFCRQACNYCNFHFSTSLRYKNELIAALLKEFELFAGAFPGETVAPRFFHGPAAVGHLQNGWISSRPPSEPVETIYIGGGTPSLLDHSELQRILDTVRSSFEVSRDAEITLEANPDDLSETQLLSWRELGINRLSIGVQSFFEEDLRWMNRAHNAVQAEAALQLALLHFDNITIDLIYGTPGLTDEKWSSNVRKAVSLGVPHLSCYALTVEPNTPLQKMITGKKVDDVDPDKQSAQFLLLMNWLKEAGYEHYEISNFARPGFRSRHNSSYWKGKPYYGFGPSAHSFNGHERWWNISNNNAYMASINKDVIPFEKETLTPAQRFNEYIMIALRTDEGVDLSRIRRNEWKMAASELDKIVESLLKKSRGYEKRELVELKGDELRLTMQGKLLADGIAADLFAD